MNSNTVIKTIDKDAAHTAMVNLLLKGVAAGKTLSAGELDSGVDQFEAAFRLVDDLIKRLFPSQTKAKEES